MYNLKAAFSITYKERLKFVKYYDAINKFIDSNNVIVGGKLGLKTLFKHKLNYDEFVYHLYGDVELKNELSKWLVKNKLDFYIDNIHKTTIFKTKARPLVYLHYENSINYQEIDIKSNLKLKIFSDFKWMEHITYILTNLSLIDEWDYWYLYFNLFKKRLNLKSGKYKTFDVSKYSLINDYLNNIEYCILSYKTIFVIEPNKVLEELSIYNFEYKKYRMGFFYKITLSKNNKIYLNLIGYNQERLIPVVLSKITNNNNSIYEAHPMLKLAFLFANYNNLKQLNIGTKKHYDQILYEINHILSNINMTYKQFIGYSYLTIRYPNL